MMNQLKIASSFEGHYVTPSTSNTAELSSSMSTSSACLSVCCSDAVEALADVEHSEANLLPCGLFPDELDFLAELQANASLVAVNGNMTACDAWIEGGLRWVLA